MVERPVELLFSLLRISLGTGSVDESFFRGFSDEEWNSCYNVAVKQGVFALAWDGVQLLPQPIQPPKQLKFKWAMSVDKYEAKHRRYCATVQDLQSFYASKGIVAVQMKGVGFSANYNVPYHREGGDIDIFTFSADELAMSHREANELADTLMQNQGIEVEMHSYKHSNFIFKGIPVENHKMFLNVEIKPDFLGWLNSYLREVISPQKVEMYKGEYNLLVPSPEFNTLFISCHAFQHYGSGIALHHLYDWSVILKNYGLHLPDELKHTPFLRGIAAMTHLCNVHLGTDISLEGFPDKYEKMADEMLKEMLYPIYSKHTPYTNYASIFFYKCKKVLRSARLAKSVFGSSIYGRLKESFIAHIKNPSTIFG